MTSSTGDFSGSFRLRVELPKSARDASLEYRCRLQAVYDAPSRRSQPLLHPFKKNGGLWIGIDDSVTNFIRRTWQGNFWGPWKNWSDVKKHAPEKIQAWWGTFVQNYYWNPVFEDMVFYEWKEKTKKEIGEEISRKKREGSKPTYISDSDWEILMEEWQSQKSIEKSQKAASSRNTKIDDKEMHKHSVGPRSFSKIDYGLKQKGQGSQPPSILDLVKETHRRSDGSYVDPVVEVLVKDVEEAASQYQDSSGTADSTTGPSREVINQMYLERAKPRYGHVYGVGSARTQFYNPSVQYPCEPQADLRGEINEMKSKIGSMEGKIDMMVSRLFGGQSSSSRSQPEDFDPSQLHSVRLEFDPDP